MDAARMCDVGSARSSLKWRGGAPTMYIDFVKT